MSAACCRGYIRKEGGGGSTGTGPGGGVLSRGQLGRGGGGGKGSQASLHKQQQLDRARQSAKLPLYVAAGRKKGGGEEDTHVTAAVHYLLDTAEPRRVHKQ